MPQSPHTKPKSVGRSPCRDSIPAPTPEKPRSYNPSRNLAYTPPVSPELKVSPEFTPERTRRGQENTPNLQSDKENSMNSGDPEVSPERKTRLQTLQSLPEKWNSPKDDLTDKMEARKSAISKLASPARSEYRSSRRTIASATPAQCGEVKRSTSIGELAKHRKSLVTHQEVENMSRNNGLCQVLEDVPEVEEGKEVGQTHFSSVKMAVFSDKGFCCDPLGTSAPHNKGFVGRFPGDTRIALRGVPPADHVKGEQLLTPRTAERCPHLQGVMQQMPGGGAPIRNAQVFHPAACLSPQQRYQQASPLRNRPQLGPVLAAGARGPYHMKPGVMPPQVLHHRAAVYAAPPPHQVHAPHGKQVFVARIPEAYGKSNMMRRCAPNPK